MFLHNFIREHSSGDMDLCHLMPPMIQLLKQVFLPWMHFVIVWQHPFLLRRIE
jgi:hypothetical protein